MQTLEIKLRNGNLDDLSRGLNLIKERIPEKSGILMEDILGRIKNRDYYIKIAEKDNILRGIYLWYNLSEIGKSCYLWLGAVKESGNGTGSLLMQGVLEDMKELGYSVVYVKAKSSNKAGQRVLEKYGFEPYLVDDNGIMYLKKKNN